MEKTQEREEKKVRSRAHIHQKNTIKSTKMNHKSKQINGNNNNKKPRIYLIVMDFLVHFLVGTFFLLIFSPIQHECARENGHQKKIDVSEKGNNNDRCWTAAAATATKPHNIIEYYYL